jgi:hypothetical protein
LEVGLDDRDLAANDEQDGQHQGQEAEHEVEVVAPVALHNIDKLDQHSSKRLVKNTYARGRAPPRGKRVFILRYQGIGGISLDSLLTLPGLVICPFLKPMKEPSHEFGI